MCKNNWGSLFLQYRRIRALQQLIITIKAIKLNTIADIYFLIEIPESDLEDNDDHDRCGHQRGYIDAF